MLAGRALPPNLIAQFDDHRVQAQLQQTRQRLRPSPGRPITVYVCGITPYDTTHLGHAFTYIVFDVLLPDLGTPTKAELEAAMKGHVLAQAQIMGTYQKKRP